MKKHLLFNQSFGTVGSPNQTDETLTRENRIGLMSYLRRTLMLLFAVLTLSIGQMWGGEVTYARSACSFGSNNLVYITNEGDRDDNISSVTITNRSNDNTGFKVTGKTGSNSVVTITPASGITLTQVVFTFNAAVNTSSVNMYDGNTTSSTPLTPNAGKTTFTWTGSSTAAKAFGYLNASGTSNNYGLITSITITYSGGGGATSHSVSAVTSTGTNDYGTVSAAASSVAEGGTTTITAVPASGYRVTNWAVSGTGANISPSGASNATSTTLTMGTADATVTVTFGAIPSHTITYTNTKSMDNSANPTSYYEGVGVASFTKLRHAVGYDFTGWSPSSISSSATTDQTIDAQWTARAAATGTGTLTYALAFESSIITTSSITRNNGALYDATDVSIAHTSFNDGATKNGCSGKLTTTSSKDGNNYVELTFKIADGYTFTPTEVQVKGNAVSTAKTMEVELKDNAATPNTKSVTGSLAAGSTSGGSTVTLDFDASGTVTLEGTVTLKIFVYGAENHWRLGTSIIITGTVAEETPSTCADKYSFHYGPAVGDWETPICFEQVGSTHEWNITNFTIPDHTNGQFYVGYEGSTNSQSLTKAWTDSYSDGNGAMKLLPGGTAIVGQATGAVGTINMWDDSGWKNQNVGFTPNGYGITYGGSGHAFHTTATAHMLETDVVTLPDVSTTYTMGLATATPGTYVTCAHSSASEALSAMGVTEYDSGKKKIYLYSTADSWIGSNAKMAIFDFTDSRNCWGDNTDANKFMTKVNDNLWVGYVQGDATNIILVRVNPENSDPGWGWGQSHDITLSALNNYFTITGTWSDSKAEYTVTSTHPTTGQKGKFRMWDDSGSSNWYVHWIPYYVLSYDANGGSGTTAATERSSESGTITVTVAANGFTAPAGYTFAGWATNEARADEGTVDYAVGADYSLTSDATLYAVWNCITPDAPAAGKITATDGCGEAASFSADIAGLPSYVTWYWQTSSNGTSTSNPASTEYTTDAAAGSKTIYLRAKNTVCGSWSDAATKSATVRTAVTAAWNTAPADGTVGGSMTASVTTNYSAGLRFSSSDATVASVNETSGAISYLKAGTTTITATVTGAGSYCSTASVNKSITVSAAASLTAIEENTLYQPLNMLCTGMSPLPGSDTYFTDDAYSTDNRFYYDVSSGNGPKAHTISEVTLGSGQAYEATFTSEMWVKGTSTVTDGIPSAPSIKFLTPSTSGTLYLYIESGSCPVKFKKEDGAASNITGLTQVVSGKIYSTTVEANSVYYIYGNGGSNTGVYGLKLITCSTPAAPTAFSAGSITSTGATFSITDAGDAASYDIYYATSSTAPTASTPATTTSTSKTKAVTGLTASTTYYAWVRSVCDADHKSAWVALSGSSFTTTSTPAELTAIEANVLYQAADMANITFTGSDQWFAGLSTNAKFKTYGDGSSTSAKGKTVSSTSITDDIDTKNFTSIAYIMTADNTSSTSDPTKGAIEFITPSSAGDLYLYFENTSSALTLKKKGTSTSLSLSGAKYKKIAVEANTHYFINGAGSNRGLYGIKFIADVTAPTFVSSVPANGATGVATSGTIVLTFSEALGTVDASKFTLTGATKGAVAIDGSDATKVNIAYSGAEEEATVTLATAAAAVSDLAGNALAAALSDISFTTAAAAPAGDCDELFAGRATSTSVFTPSAGSATFNLSSGNSFSAGGYSYSVKPNSSNAIVASPKAGGSFSAGDSLIVVIYNNESGSKTMGFRLGSGTYNTSVGSKKLHIFRQVLVASDISAGKVTFNRQSSDDRWVEIIIKHCGLLPSCTTPILPTLTAKTVCEGGDADAAWNAAITNSGSLVSGETVAYSWVKKGGSTPVSSVATYQPTDVTEAMAGTYVVTATVSADGKASKSASQEVDLSVTEGTEAPTVTQSTTPVYEGNSVTLTATATTGATYTWHTCNADGTGESSAISGATTNAYTIAGAPAAGTHYYKVKVTGDGTHTCGNAETVYALTVSEAAGGDCFHFVSVIPESNINISSGASIVTPTHATTLEGGTMKVGSQQVVITAGYGLKMEGTKTVSITLDAALEAGNVVIVKGTSGTKGYGITINGVNFYDADNKTFDVSYTVVADDGLEGQTALSVSKYSGNSYLQEVKITGCGESCTDPEVTASADNTTACVGTSVTFTATGAHAEATYQWQKLDGTWTNISGETASTYNIASVVAGDAGKYRVIASHVCNRTSNEVTLSVPSAPDFGSTVPASVSVMQTIALSINTVEATDAVKYRWYKSADATWDAGDVEIGTNKELIKAYDSEAIGSPSYYIFCRAQNACGITTSTAIAVNVTAYVEEDCATRGNEGDAAFSFENSGCGQGTYNSASCWTMNSNSKKLIYAAPEGKYFKTMKVTIASSSASKASYNWSTNGGTTFTEVAINSINTTLTEKTIDVSAHGNVNALQIGRNLDGKGESSGTLYVSKICFEYTDACTATTVTPSTSSVNYEMGDEWTDPTFTLSVAGTLTYSSSNEDIASVDDDGTVTFNGDAGTVTITASYAGGTISETEYCASQGSYTITVSCSGGAPKVVPDGTVNMSGCNASVTLNAKKQDGTAFADGTYQWFRNGEEIDGATSSSYTATQAGTYTVERTNASDCTTPSTNSAIVTSETTEPEVERLVPFQYYHVNKDYSDQMKMRHLFAVKNSGTLDGKHFKMYVSRNGGVVTDVTSSNALVVWPNGDGHVDTVMVDLNKLNDKYTENDELVFTCKAIDCSGNVSDVYKNTITMNVIGATPTLALICSGSSKAEGTRKTGELTVGGDFLTGYNVADLCQQTGNTSFDANTEWGLYTDLKAHYIVTPVNGYAVFNKLNYEPFDILLLTDYPKASKSDAAKNVLDDMAALCDYRPMLSFKTHMVAKSPSKWAAKGFTTSATENKADGRLNLNIVCYAHPMFEHLKDGTNVYRDADNSSELVYTMLSGTGYEGNKGMQGFEIDAAENFVTIGLTHYNASAAPNTPSTGNLKWTPGSGDRMLVTVAERQTNIEARFILFSINCGAQSKLTDKGEEVILACLEYLLDDDPLHVADCSFTFDNGANAPYDAEWYKDPAHCPGCSGTMGDGLWSTEANWGPERINIPGEFTSARIAAPVTVDVEHAKAMELRIIDEGRIDIPAGKALDVKSTIRRMDGSEIYPTEIGDIHIGSASTGNGTLIFNNNSGDTKARVDMYSKGFIDGEGVKNYQYIGTPFIEVNALYNYYGSWIYGWGEKKNGNLGWVVVKNGGPMTAWTGYCITQEAPTTHAMSGTLTATGTVDINVPANANMVVGNSWTAPIDINALTTDDLEGLTANIYFFNTGVDKTGEAGAAGSRYAGSTYVTVPVHSAPYTGDDHINSLQGFFVKNTGGSAGTLHLDYERHVRKTTRDNILSDEMHAPARRTALSSDEPVVLKMKVSGENYDDKLLLLEREDFTEGFDNGWDGDKWDGNESALYIYTTDSEGTENSVSAIPELEGTIIGFRAGEDDAYTLHFEYLNSDETLYLYDVENNTYTQIMTGMTYRFFTTDNEKHERFIITRSNGQEVATGVESTSGSLDRSKAKKLLIEDKMFIMVNGMLYDATGKVVK